MTDVDSSFFFTHNVNETYNNNQLPSIMLSTRNNTRPSVHIAHRGCIDKENTIDGIVEALQTFSAVEIDVMHNTKGKLILCHTRSKQIEAKDTFKQLCSRSNPMHLYVDIKAVGVASAKTIARDVLSVVEKYPQHKYELCSLNEYCVAELIDLRMMMDHFGIGVISYGVPMGLFSHLPEIDFVMLHHDTVHEEVVDALKYNQIKIYAWACDTHEIRSRMMKIHNIDGFIYDYTSPKHV